MPFRIKKDDLVQVIAGKDKGARGKVLEVIVGKDKVLVEGVNIVTKHRRARRQGAESGLIKMESPIHVSNVMIVDPKTDKPSRIGAQVSADGKKERIAKRSGTVV